MASGIVRKKEVVNIGFGILNLMISNGGFKSSSQSGKAFLILIFLERNDIERYIYIYTCIYYVSAETLCTSAARIIFPD